MAFPCTGQCFSRCWPTINPFFCPEYPVIAINENMFTYLLFPLVVSRLLQYVARLATDTAYAGGWN
jgi:hypothetical protein